MVIFEIAKMEFGQKKFHEIDLFDFTSFFALNFLIFWPKNPSFHHMQINRQIAHFARDLNYFTYATDE